MERIHRIALPGRKRTTKNTQKYRRIRSIKKSEIKVALTKLNRNIATKLDGIVIEMRAALDDFDIDKV